MSETVDEIFGGLKTRFKPGVVTKAQTFYFSIDEHHYTVTVRPDDCEVEAGKTVESADCFVNMRRPLM